MTRARFVLILALLVLVAGCTSPATPDAGAATTERPSTTAAIDTGSSATPVPSTRPTVTATVVDIVDGDTVKIRYENGSRDTVRLLGVDTPEVHVENTPDEFEGVPETDAGRQCLRQYGERASEFAKAELGGETVRLGFDENEGRRGYYGRLLAYVYVDGEQFNYRLVAEGYARMYDSDFVERERYAAAERTAQQVGHGVWSCATAMPDGGTDDGITDGTDGSDDASGDSTLRIDVHPDAAGDDRGNLNDEYVVITNTGETGLDVGGWTVSDAAGHTYTVPEGTTLDPGASLTLHTGDGADSSTDRYWGRSTPVWNNGGDTVTVRDDGGRVVATRTYSG